MEQFSALFSTRKSSAMRRRVKRPRRFHKGVGEKITINSNEERNKTLRRESDYARNYIVLVCKQLLRSFFFFFL